MFMSVTLEPERGQTGVGLSVSSLESMATFSLPVVEAWDMAGLSFQDSGTSSEW